MRIVRAGGVDVYGAGGLDMCVSRAAGIDVCILRAGGVDVLWLELVV